MDWEKIRAHVMWMLAIQDNRSPSLLLDPARIEQEYADEWKRLRPVIKWAIES